MIDDAARIRVIRAILNMTSRKFAGEIGVSPVTLCSWEQARTGPTLKHRNMLGRLCEARGIGFLPSGMPVPFKDCLIFKEEKPNA